MTKPPHPITPPPELVASLRNSAPHGIRDAGVTRELWLINKAYAAGADQELEACVEWLDRNSPVIGGFHLRIDRRPKPPSLKEQALEALEVIPKLVGFESERDAIRRALETLPE